MSAMFDEAKRAQAEAHAALSKLAAAAERREAESWQLVDHRVGPCVNCNGSGTIESAGCPACGGTGTAIESWQATAQALEAQLAAMVEQKTREEIAHKAALVALAAANARAEAAEGFRDGCTSVNPCGACVRCVTETLRFRDAAWAERDALRAQLRAAVARAEAAESAIDVAADVLEIPSGSRFDADTVGAALHREIAEERIRVEAVMRIERDALRADLARVTAERDALRGVEADLLATCDGTQSMLTQATRELASAREEAAALRRRVEDFRKALKITASFDHSENCVGRYDENGDVDDEDYQDEHCDCGVGPARLALAAPVAEPVPPATDAAALLREARRVFVVLERCRAIPNGGEDQGNLLDIMDVRQKIDAALASSDGSRS